MTARERRLMSDYQKVKKDFAGHKNIIVTPMGGEPPESYHVTYFVNGIYLLPDGKIETLGRHEVDITLHADYPRYKPICKILTPIWHPNFRDGQICIGDIWGAGESLSDIIINIGDMIQYKSWNSSSPLSADAAKWAIDNKHLFPVGNIELNIADYASEKDTVDIDLFDANGEKTDDSTEAVSELTPATVAAISEKSNENDFDITPDELAGIQFVPTAQRMQTIQNAGGMVKGGGVNFMTILTKGLLWAFIGVFLGFVFTELFDPLINQSAVARTMGYSYLSEYLRKTDMAVEKYSAGEKTSAYKYYSEAEDELEKSYEYEFNSDEDKILDKMKSINRIQTGLWSAFIALFVGLFLGIGEGIFYGSGNKAVKFGAIGAGVSLALGFFSGYIAQLMYSKLLGEDPSDFAAAFVRGLGWSILGLGIGVSVGLIKPDPKRMLFCSLGGLGGGFLGGFLFNYVLDIIPNDTVARGVAVIVMGILIGVGVGLLEQFAKQAWLKVVRGEFEGKEYLVFAGTTSIGNNGKNTIVLFKDRLVGPHHCDIVLEGSKYVLNDCGTPMGTVVNGMRVSRHVLRQGDAISIGNSVLIFNTR